MRTIRPGYNDLLTWCNNNGSRGQLLVDEWNQEKNYNEYGMPIVMQELIYGSGKKFWWKCKSCGNDFQMSPVCRTMMGQGCPICGHKRGGIKNHLNSLQNGNDLYSWCKENGIFGKKIMDEWDTRKNMDLLGIGIADVSCGYGKKVYWICSRCGEKFESTVSHRTICGSGCKHCNKFSTSFPEQVIYHAIKQIYPDTISRGKVFGKVEYDICIPQEKLCIEYNGTYWHKDRHEKDEMKRDICKAHNVRFIQIIANSTGVEWEICGEVIKYRISYSKHLMQLHNVIEYILRMLGHNMYEVDFDKAVDSAYQVMYNEVENNIKILYPEMMCEWDYESNGSRLPEYFTAGSHYRADWKCKKCGNKWDVEIRSRIKFRTGCPKCGYNVFDGKRHTSSIHKKGSMVFQTFI